MRTGHLPINHIAALLALVLVIGGCSESDTIDDAEITAVAATPNAADEYRRLFATAEQYNRRFGHDIRPSREAIDWLVQNQQFIDRVTAVSRIERCDWRTDFSAGWNVRLPHLSSMGNLSGTLAAEAQRRADAADHVGVAEIIAAQIRLARHVSDEPATIAAMVAISILSRAVDQADALLAKPGVPHEPKQIVLRALDTLDPADPVQSRQTLATERMNARHMILTGYRSLRRDELMEGFQPLAGMTEAQRRELADEVDVLLHQFEQAWFAPQLEGQFLAIENQASPLAREFVSVMWPMRRQVERIRERIASVRSALEQ